MPRVISRVPFRVALVLGCMAGAIGAATAGVPACEQQGTVPAMPPLLPAPIHLHECTGFSGPAASVVGPAWCKQAAETVFPGAKPPKVTMLPHCPPGALARCDVRDPAGTVSITRYFYVADAAAGGLANLRKMCEGSGRRPDLPAGVFTLL